MAAKPGGIGDLAKVTVSSQELLMLDVDDLAAEIDERLAALPERRAADLRAVRRELSGRVAAAPAREVVALALRLVEGDGFERRFLAYEVLNQHRAALASLDAADVERLGQGMDSWAAVDTFGCYVAGPAWRERQIEDGRVAAWAASPDRWWRRAAMASTVALNCRARGGRGDTARTLAVCSLLVADRDDMVVKALSWALRELAKGDPAAVEGFLAEHEVRLAARVRREVGSKLTSGLKNPRTRLSAATAVSPRQSGPGPS
jgi:3-methyladenine DNA glycosylase AlkD